MLDPIDGGWAPAWEFGESAGHPFRGNQYTDGTSGGDGPNLKPIGDITPSATLPSAEEAYNAWSFYAEQAPMRYAAEEMLGVDHRGWYGASDDPQATANIVISALKDGKLPPAEKTNPNGVVGNNGYAVKATQAAVDQAASMLNAAYEQPPVEYPLYRGLNFDTSAQSDNFGRRALGQLKVGDEMRIGLESFTPDAQSAAGFGTSVTIKTEGPIRGYTPTEGYETSVQDPNGEWVVRQFETVVTGRMEVTSIERSGSWSGSTPPSTVITIRQKSLVAAAEFGDLPGHDFHGNQWTTGESGFDFSSPEHGEDFWRGAFDRHDDSYEAAIKQASIAARGHNYGTKEYKEAWAPVRDHGELRWGVRTTPMEDILIRPDRAIGAEGRRFHTLNGSIERAMPYVYDMWDKHGPTKDFLPNVDQLIKDSKAEQERSRRWDDEPGSDVPLSGVWGAYIEHVRTLQRIVQNETSMTASVELGDLPGHAFHGNQWQPGESGDGFVPGRKLGEYDPSKPNKLSANPQQWYKDRDQYRLLERQATAQGVMSDGVLDLRNIKGADLDFATKLKTGQPVVLTGIHFSDHHGDDIRRTGFNDATKGSGQYGSGIYFWVQGASGASNNVPYSSRGADRFVADVKLNNPVVISAGEEGSDDPTPLYRAIAQDSRGMGDRAGYEAVVEQMKDGLGFDRAVQTLLMAKGHDGIVVTGDRRGSMVVAYKPDSITGTKAVRASVEFGDFPGHPFRGNQWQDGEGGSAETPWTPKMSPEAAKAWASTSAWTQPMLHITSGVNAQAIEHEGFKPSAGQAVWGKGIYLALDHQTAEIYRGWKGATAVTAYAKIENPLVVKTDTFGGSNGATVREALSEATGVPHGEIEHEYENLRVAAHEEYERLIEEARAKYGDNALDHTITAGARGMQVFERNLKTIDPEMNQRIVEATYGLDETSITAQIVQAHGFDSMLIDNTKAFSEGPGGNQLLVFDPKDIVVTDAATPKERFNRLLAEGIGADVPQALHNVVPRTRL